MHFQLAFTMPFTPMARPRLATTTACARPPAKRSARPRSRPQRENTDVSAYSLADTVRDSPLLNSTLMNAMRDYFGDDGREVQDYMKRPRNENGEPMFRCVIVGSGERELQLARVLSGSDVMRGLYYCPDHDAVCDIEMNKFAQSATISAETRPEDVVRFATWCVADAVFIGPDRQHRISREVEGELAQAGITVFQHDVSAAIAEGAMDVKECLLPLAQSESDTRTEDQLVEDEVVE